MPDILMQFDVGAEPAAVFDALTTEQGLAGWWSTRAEVPSAVGQLVKVSFPDAPMTWDLRIVDSANRIALPGIVLVGRPSGSRPISLSV